MDANLPSSPINQKWIFGYHAGLDFSTFNPAPIPTTGSKIDTFEGCASISDSAGHLLFYTNGVEVWDSSHNTQVLDCWAIRRQPNRRSSSLTGQCSSIYIFTADGWTGSNNHFDGVLLDTSTWGDTPLGIPVPNASPTEKVVAVQHANCTDYWVITIVQEGETGAKEGMGTFRVFSVTTTGVQHVADTPMQVNIGDAGYLKASPNGDRLAVANLLAVSGNSNVFVYEFDAGTGAIDIASAVTLAVPNIVPTTHPRQTYGVEFSPNGKLIYYTVLGAHSTTGATADGYIFQVDLSTPSAFTLVRQYQNDGNRYALGALQLGIDGRIYIAKDGESSLGAILDPNIVGSGCKVDMDFISLPGDAICYLGLPNLLPNPCHRAFSGPCEEVTSAINDHLAEACSGKVNQLRPCRGEPEPCSCLPGFGSQHEKCQEVRLPDIKPCISISWGDSDCDCMETDDVEILCITICNCYTNVTFGNLTIGYLWVYDENGNAVPTLRDGGPSVAVAPIGRYASAI